MDGAPAPDRPAAELAGATLTDRPMTKGSNDPASFGAEALPAGYSEISRAMRGQTAATTEGTAIERARAPLVGLIALAAHWMKKRGGRA